MTGIVYKFTNKIDGKVYIGQTINEYYRYNCHKNAKCKSYFHAQIREIGFENFEYEVIFKCVFDNKNDAKIVLEDRERQAILDYMSWNPEFGYNKSLGVGSTGAKFTQTELQKTTMKRIHTGKKLSPETIEKMKNSLKGKTAWNKGKQMSDTTKLKLSKSHAKYKNIQQYDMNNNLIGEFDDINDAEIQSGCCRGAIIGQLNGKIKKPCKYIWKIKIE